MIFCEKRNINTEKTQIASFMAKQFFPLKKQDSPQWRHWGLSSIIQTISMIVLPLYANRRGAFLGFRHPCSDQRCDPPSMISSVPQRRSSIPRPTPPSLPRPLPLSPRRRVSPRKCPARPPETAIRSYLPMRRHPHGVSEWERAIPLA